MGNGSRRDIRSGSKNTCGTCGMQITGTRRFGLYGMGYRKSRGTWESLLYIVENRCPRKIRIVGASNCAVLKLRQSAGRGQMVFGDWESHWRIFKLSG